MDTRPYRLECFSAFSGGAYAVDMEVIQRGKSKMFADLLGAPSQHCTVADVTLDFLDDQHTLASELPNAGFDLAKPSVFLAEGLIMYLGAQGKLKLLRDVSAVAAPGSMLVLQYMDASDSTTADENARAAALSVDEAKAALAEGGWDGLRFSRFGDESLDFGRFPKDRFGPQAGFSFVVATKK